MRLTVVCVDIGSPTCGAFAWSAALSSGGCRDNTTPQTAVETISAELTGGAGVALGFECPLFVPVVERQEELTSARRGEGNRPWSAGAGAAVLALGVAEVTWILRALRTLHPATPAFLKWGPFSRSDPPGLFLWEAMVTGAAKRGSHAADARAAVEAFLAALPDPTEANAVTCAECLSLIGAALLRTGWSSDHDLLAAPCVVIKAQSGAA